jgi:hypothetical protein
LRQAIGAAASSYALTALATASLSSLIERLRPYSASQDHIAVADPAGQFGEDAGGKEGSHANGQHLGFDPLVHRYWALIESILLRLAKAETPAGRGNFKLTHYRALRSLYFLK